MSETKLKKKKKREKITEEADNKTAERRVDYEKKVNTS